MHLAYVISVFLHILAAVVWMGGMATLILVIVPWLRRGDRAKATAMLRDTATRLRNIGWICFAVFLITGSFNLWVRGVRLSSFTRTEFLTSPFGQLVCYKLGLFLLIVGLSALHDFWVGPNALQQMEHQPQSTEAERMRRRAGHMGRLNALLALLIVLVAVMLVRGRPW